MADGLAGMAAGQSCEFAADTAADPAPYTRVLSAFRVVASSGPVRVSVAEDTLVATGSHEMLARFASFFVFSDGDRLRGPDTTAVSADFSRISEVLAGPLSTHHHHEWWEGNEYIAADSQPLVISRS
jgi:hypothetical protein